jgi:hypothetical protein
MREREATVASSAPSETSTAASVSASEASSSSLWRVGMGVFVAFEDDPALFVF